MAEMEQPKKVADRYLKQEVLGQGTYGVVFKATDTKVPKSPFLISSNPPMELGFLDLLGNTECLRIVKG